MVRIEIITQTGRSLGRTTGVENCYTALRDAGVVRYSINTVGEAITKYFAGQAQDCTIRPREHYELMGVQMRDGTVGLVRLWCDQWQETATVTQDNDPRHGISATGQARMDCRNTMLEVES